MSISARTSKRTCRPTSSWPTRRAVFSAPMSGSVTKSRQRRQTSSPRMIPTPSRRRKKRPSFTTERTQTRSNPRGAPMAVVALDGLTKRYGAFLAVDQVSFELGKGEILGLLGPNGSGKTTILRMLTGYLRPSAGTAQVAGFDIVRDGRAARGRVGYVPEDAPLYRHMRVNEFLSFMGRLRGLEQEKLRERLFVARERFALQDMGDAIVGRLSRGYRQRVSLAQAVLHEPDLLVLDEPTNGLDPRQIIEFRELIRQAAEQCAILITSHILGEMERIADRVAILLQGRLLAVKNLDTAKAFCVRACNEIAPRVGALLESMAGAAEIVEEARDGERVAWRVRITGPKPADRLAEGLCAAGLGVVEVTEMGSDLERTFLALTKAQAVS